MLNSYIPHNNNEYGLTQYNEKYVIQNGRNIKKCYKRYVY